MNYHTILPSVVQFALLSMGSFGFNSTFEKCGISSFDTRFDRVNTSVYI